MMHQLATRTLGVVPVMFFVALFVFCILHFAPGDPAVILAGDMASPEQVERIREALGLNKTLLSQFIDWLARVLTGDFGTSIFSKVPVTELIAQRLPATLSLMLLTLVFSVTVAIPIGVLAATNHNSLADRIVTAFTTLSFSIPVFVLGYGLVYIFSTSLGLLPVQGYAPLSAGIGKHLSHLLLPALSLSSVYIAMVARISRTTMLEALSQDYIRTARAKGVGRRSILYVHALKNTSLPVVTVIGLGIGMLISGAVVTESVFAIPGVGRLTIDAVARRDVPVIQGIVLMFSAMYIALNFLIDVLYVILDPRVRY